MTREIKFRIRYTYYSEKIQTMYSTLEEIFYINGDDWTGEILSKDEYTGLKDKNGKEIYEGDILFGFTTPNKYSKKKGVRCLVKWDIYKACWYLDGDLRSYKHTLPLLSFLTKKEVVGNIYENPELLEVRK